MTWRVGRKVGRTVYDGDTLIGVMDTPELAARVVAAVNAPCDCEERSEAMWRLLVHVADGPTPQAQAQLAAALLEYHRMGQTVAEADS